RLDDDRSQRVGVYRDERLDGGEVVVGGDQHLALEDVRDARRVRRGGGERLGRLRRRAHQRIVVAAVVPALELHDLLALTVGARRSEREEGRLGSGRREAYLFGARHRPTELIGQRDDGLVHEEVGGSV